jgi:hypothetical protein
MSRMKRLSFLSLFTGLLSFALLGWGADPAPTAPNGNSAKSGGETPAVEATDQSTETSPAMQTPKRRKIGVGPTSIAVVSEPGGLKTLTIHFRWSLIPDASIEVRLVPDPVAEGTEVAPIYFHEHLNDKVRQQIYDCLDHSDRGGRSHSFTKDKVVYKMIGRLNSLGNQSVHVQVKKQDADPTKAPAPAAAYLQLDTWAVDKDTIALDLARDEFAQPGVLFVWFFRGDKAIWQEQIRWPGYK